jgi:hypothetical protein
VAHRSLEGSGYKQALALANVTDHKPAVDLPALIAENCKVRDLLSRARQLKAQPAVSGKSMTAQAQVALKMDPKHADYLVDVLKEAQRSAAQRR